MIGREVIDVIDREHLRENALDVGNYLLDRLRDVAARRELIGDVRGNGLFVGVELAADREKRIPNGAAAGYVANRMRELGVLLSTDGPDHNVLKIKPPLCFSRSDADLLSETLDRVLGESAINEA
jgi:4-aminobutyrate aminotransferase-like enzyme